MLNNITQSGASSVGIPYNYNSEIYNYYRDYLFSQYSDNESRIVIYTSKNSNDGIGTGVGYVELYLNCTMRLYSSGGTGTCYNYRYKEALSTKLGYRPVLTLKLGNNKTDKKDIVNGLKVGDYVKYSANNYDGWKVLSIDEKNNTIDIISSGIVKNLQLQGMDDYDNY